MTGSILVGGIGDADLLQAASVAAGIAEAGGASLRAVTISEQGTGSAAVVDGMVDVALVFEAGAEGLVSGAALADGLELAARELSPNLVILGDHPACREAAARLALRLSAGCVSMCERIQPAGEDGFRVERAAYGGVANAIFTVPGRAVCVLAATASAEGAGEAQGRATEVQVRALTGGARSIRKLSEEAVPPSVDLAGARVVVSVGRGFVKAEDIRLAEDLRSLLDAELGCSRPIAEDFKWLPQERLVGLTGTSVSSDLYLALGISGQVQHLAGIKGARVVAAVNIDPKSPIVRNADYTVIGDLYKVVPALAAALEARRNGG
ncbi:MAG: hypothetical protein Kow00129_09160 [Thermoleophilia bacterium]